jgi:hypothetical protein
MSPREVLCHFSFAVSLSRLTQCQPYARDCYLQQPQHLLFWVKFDVLYTIPIATNARTSCANDDLRVKQAWWLTNALYTRKLRMF